jgi:2-desacetyl-2-hydroxyethyl bacteriochlorophyllide A dehydrogenase
MKDVPVPVSNGKDVIIKVTQVGMCGSDIHILDQGERVGLIMGHEFVGKVVDPGAPQATLKVGDRVTVIPLNPCGTCAMCKIGKFNQCLNGLKASPGVSSAGAYTEFYASRPDMVRKLPDSISDDEAAMLEPTTCASHAVRLANVALSDKVLIVGGGVIGQLAAMWARISGAGYVALMETNPERREIAKKMGDADDVFDPSDEKELARIINIFDGGCDKAIDCSGNSGAINGAIKLMKNGGRLVLVGINYNLVPISTLLICLKEIELKGDIGYFPEEFDNVIAMVAQKRVNVVRFVSSKMKLDKAQDAYAKLTAPGTKEVKILMQP